MSDRDYLITIQVTSTSPDVPFGMPDDAPDAVRVEVRAPSKGRAHMKLGEALSRLVAACHPREIVAGAPIDPNEPPDLRACFACRVMSGGIHANHCSAK